MKTKIKNYLATRSPLLLVITICEIILSVFSTMAFVYSDSLSYSDSAIYNALGVEKLLESLYSSTFWAFILVILAMISIFSLTAFLYKKLEFLFISTCLWCEMLILAFDLQKSLLDNMAMLAIFIPIIFLHVIAYNQAKEKQKIKGKKTKDNEKK